ncbi:MAG: DUF2085 domain-containing protein [Bacilli bacterium]
MTFWELLKERWQLLGQAPLCNGQPETTFQVFGFSFILCYRCTFIIIGLLLTTFVFSKLKTPLFSSKKQQILLMIMGLLILIADGANHHLLGNETTNLLRILTGFFGGIGFGLFVNIIFPPKFVQ